MKHRIAALVVFAGLLLATAVRAQTADEAKTANTGAAGGNLAPDQRGPALTGVRRPLYRLHKSDVVEVRFTFSPEFDQSLTVQPDGLISLKGVGDLPAEGLSGPELRESIRVAYQPVLRDPEVSVMLKDFEKPFFVAGGQVGIPESTSFAHQLALLKQSLSLEASPIRPNTLRLCCFERLQMVCWSHTLSTSRPCWLLEIWMKTRTSDLATCYSFRRTGFQK